MIYKLFSATLNPAQSINLLIIYVQHCTVWFAFFDLVLIQVIELLQ